MSVLETKLISHLAATTQASFLEFQRFCRYLQLAYAHGLGNPEAVNERSHRLFRHTQALQGTITDRVGHAEIPVAIGLSPDELAESLSQLESAPDWLFDQLQPDDRQYVLQDLVVQGAFSVRAFATTRAFQILHPELAKQCFFRFFQRSIQDNNLDALQRLTSVSPEIDDLLRQFFLATPLTHGQLHDLTRLLENCQSELVRTVVSQSLLKALNQPTAQAVPFQEISDASLDLHPEYSATEFQQKFLDEMPVFQTSQLELIPALMLSYLAYCISFQHPDTFTQLTGFLADKTVAEKESCLQEFSFLLRQLSTLQLEWCAQQLVQIQDPEIRQLLFDALTDSDSRNMPAFYLQTIRPNLQLAEHVAFLSKMHMHFTADQLLEELQRSPEIRRDFPELLLKLFSENDSLRARQEFPNVTRAKVVA